MSTLNLTSDEFADIAMVYLFDQVMNTEQVNNERLKEFIDKHRSKLKTPLLKYYLDSDSKIRLKYRRIGGIFDGSDKAIQQIRIGPSDKINQLQKGNKKEGRIKKAVKKVIKKVLAKEEISLNEINILKGIEDVDYDIFTEIDEV